MKKLLTLAAISAASLVASAAHAAVIYDGGGPDQNTAYYAEASYPFTEAAKSFTLTVGANTVGDAHWWGAVVRAIVQPAISQSHSITIMPVRRAGWFLRMRSGTQTRPLRAIL